MQDATYDFRNLPLRRVDLKVRYEPTIAISPAALLDFYSLIKERFPVPVNSLEREHVPGKRELSIRVGTFLEHAVFKSEEEELYAVFHEQMLAVSWRSHQDRDAEYPHFEKLMENLEFLVRMLTDRAPDIKPAVVQMRYQVFASQKREVPGLWFFDFQLPAVRDFLNHAPQEFEYAFRAKSGIDYRVKADEAGDDTLGIGHLITTVAGSFVGEGDWKTYLMECHKLLRSVYPSLLTRQAKEEWEYVELN